MDDSKEVSWCIVYLVPIFNIFCLCNPFHQWYVGQFAFC
jgi:hypothetical protein